MGVKQDLTARSSLSLLGALMDPLGERELEWDAVDLADMTTHALTAELEDDPAADPGTAVLLGALLAAQAPPRAQLERAKHTLKAALDGNGETLPKDVSKALYVAIIAKARTSGHSGLSRLNDAEFTRLARWCLAQGWIPGPVLDVIRKAVHASS